jgi:hypothetical protein
MKRTWLTRLSFTILILLLTFSLSGWTGSPASIPAAPNDGSWTGTTNLGKAMSFTVSSSGTQVTPFSLTTTFSSGGCTTTVTTTVFVASTITSNQFSGSGGKLSFTGQFTSNTTATGTYSFQDSPFPTGCGTGTQTGTWTATTGGGGGTVPNDGNWTGTTNLGKAMSFTVSSSGTQVAPFSLTTTFSSGGCTSNVTATVFVTNPITNGQFSGSGGNLSFTGQFTSSTTATGTYSFQDSAPPFGCGTGTQTGTWTASVPPPRFPDVPTSYWAYDFIERLAVAGITGGCGGGNYCPEQAVTRAQMAVFLLRGIHGAAYTPPAVGSTTGFGDVPTDYWAAAFIKQLAAEGITTGCGNGNYCPEHPVTRAQMAVFLLRSEHGAAYSPPGVGAGTGFGDVPTDYWAAAWIKQLVAEAITAGCGNGNYCPEQPVTRAQMAVFLVRTFNLP